MQCIMCQNGSKTVRPVVESSCGCDREDPKEESKREEYSEVNVIRNELKWRMDAMRNDLKQNFERLRLHIDNGNEKGMEESQQNIDDLQHQLTQAQRALKMKQEVRLGLQQELRKELEQMALQYQQQGNQVVNSNSVPETSSVQQACDYLEAENDALIQQIEDMKYRSEMFAHQVRLDEVQTNLRALELEANNKDLDAELAGLQMEYQSQAQRHNAIQNDLKSEISTMKKDLALNKGEIVNYMNKIKRLLVELEEEKNKGMWAKQQSIGDLQHQLNEVQNALTLKNKEQLHLQEEHRKELERIKLAHTLEALQFKLKPVEMERAVKHKKSNQLHLLNERNPRTLNDAMRFEMIPDSDFVPEKQMEAMRQSENPSENLRRNTEHEHQAQQLVPPPKRSERCLENVSKVQETADPFQDLINFHCFNMVMEEPIELKTEFPNLQMKQEINSSKPVDFNLLELSEPIDPFPWLSPGTPLTELKIDDDGNKDEEWKRIKQRVDRLKKNDEQQRVAQSAKSITKEQVKVSERCEAKVEEMRNKLAQEQLAMQKARERLKAENEALNDQIRGTKQKTKKLAEELELKKREASLRTLELETDNKGLEQKLMDLQIEYQSQAQRHNDIRDDLKSEMNTMALRLEAEKEKMRTLQDKLVHHKQSPREKENLNKQIGVTESYLLHMKQRVRKHIGSTESKLKQQKEQILMRQMEATECKLARIQREKEQVRRERIAETESKLRRKKEMLQKQMEETESHLVRGNEKRGEVNELLENLQSERDRRAKLERELRDVQKRNAELQDELAAAVDQKAIGLELKPQKNEEILMRQMEATESKLAQIQREKQEILRERIAETESKLRRKKEKIQRQMEATESDVAPIERKREEMLQVLTQKEEILIKQMEEAESHLADVQDEEGDFYDLLNHFQTERDRRTRHEEELKEIQKEPWSELKIPCTEIMELQKRKKELQDELAVAIDEKGIVLTLKKQKEEEMLQKEMDAVEAKLAQIELEKEQMQQKHKEEAESNLIEMKLKKGEVDELQSKLQSEKGKSAKLEKGLKQLQNESFTKTKKKAKEVEQLQQKIEQLKDELEPRRKKKKKGVGRLSKGKLGKWESRDQKKTGKVFTSYTSGTKFIS